MSMYGFFAAPSLGMLTQSSAFGTISQNITNLSTGGYKASDTRFSTILASTYDSNSDVGGVKTVRKNYVSKQGNTITTTNYLDVAIRGQGLFVVNSKVDGNGDTLYTRDGAFQITRGEIQTLTGGYRADGSFDTTLTGVTASQGVNKGYLTEKNGHYLMGWTPDSAGAFSAAAASGTLGPIRIDRLAFNSDAAATTNASVAGNLPATLDTGLSKTFKGSIYTSTGDQKTFEMQWTRTATPQQWTLAINPIDGTSTSTQTYTFDSTGHVPDGTTLNFTVTWDDGQTSSVALDVSDVTSIGSGFFYTDFQKDGRTPGDLESFHFDEVGHVVGRFTNGIERNLYKVPLATFTNPDGLEIRQGNLFAESLASGSAVNRVAGIDGFAIFSPFAHELSNVNLADEFNKMIMAQQAYNTSATVFRTVDEMTRTAADLKT